ncbi:hypothetical protein P6144_02835 [Sphingomonas sp. HITSZ_GF]|uniref:hypothetical protein n=1 Tax=Sphingomonas sp. HITSZ_GF TaxID=3037247 RepID=UPI00240E4D89|nr:hypothetical protein [Sphingomonas sp. HITSZ_GF]MDG2532571.1 hypothetical protein [Sphingomonas sp. HITSZ_GF]
MASTHIDLNREFSVASANDERAHPRLFGFERGSLVWADLLEKPRAVVLAEAGSGKSEEFDHRRAVLSDAGQFAFGASVSNVARLGLAASLTPADRTRFDAWKASDEALCWLFIDSVDEAKDQGHHFEDAARQLAEAIAGREERVRLIISSRFTDWDATADRLTVDKWLRMPPPPPEPVPALADEVKATLRNQAKAEKPASTDPITVLRMAGLDASRVKRFAEASGIADVEKLLHAIEHNDLWRFAARPLDLTWMVDFWRDHRRLGTLREMIEASLAARMIDPDTRRRRNDSLNRIRSGEALDRIGAGFIFCGRDSLRVPTSGIDLTPPENSIPIEDLLPEWSDGDRLALLGRPVFDPATLGRAQLHNDNEGTLRSYLAARWLNRLLERGCPVSVVIDLLFADLYGYRLLRPQMEDVSAWLANLNPTIADELIARAPLALLRNGDPGSLPIPTRIKAFTIILDRVAAIDKEKLWFMDRNLRRFADPALDAEIASWWKQAGDDTEAQHLVLRLASFGRYPAGVVLARTVAFDHNGDEITQLLAARLIIELGNDTDKNRLAQHVIAHAGDLRRSMVLEALAGLTPRFFSMDQFFALIDAIGIRDESGYKSILPIDEGLLAGLTTRDDLWVFVAQVVARSGEMKGRGEQDADMAFREAFAKLAANAAIRLLGFYPNEIPNMVTDLALLLHEARRLSDADVLLGALDREFGTSFGRRRTSYWRAVALARAHPWHRASDDVNLFHLTHHGWPVMVDESDLAWLLDDAVHRPEPIDRRNALSTASQIWRNDGATPAMFDRIKAAVASDPILSAQVDTWLTPPPEDPALAKLMAEMKSSEAKSRRRENTRDNSWIELIANLKADPSILDRLNPTTEETVDSRLFHMWQFLTWRDANRSRYAIDGLEMVEPIFGPELTAKFGAALIAFAYERSRVDRTAPKEGEARETNFDLMALGGMSLAAATTPNWAATLSLDQAREAARLAAMELNGFPAFLLDLASAKTEIVRQMLLRRVLSQLAADKPDAHGMLDRLEYADPALSLLIADDLATYVADHPTISMAMLEKIVSVLIRALPSDTTELATLSQARAEAATDPVIAAYYLLLLFAAVGDDAVDALRAKMTQFDPADQTTLCSGLLPRVVGGRFSRGAVVEQEFSVARLEEMLILAFEGIRVDEDIKHPDGEAYSIGARDEAEGARNAIFTRITATPGEATQAVFRRLMVIPNFSIQPDWLQIQSMRRAENDAALEPWFPGDVIVMERTMDRAPVTTADLQLLARRRFEDLVHDLFHHKFQQGDTLQAMADEDAVQRWLATQLEARQKESYTVQRETEVPDSKAPDIMLTSRHSGVDLPIEIKVVDGMTVADIEAALETQLCGQYLRHRTARHGILLLVHQKPRRGWTMVSGEPLVPFSTVVSHLEAKAQALREASATGPQPIVVAIDVSAILPLKAKRAAARARTAAKKAA